MRIAFSSARLKKAAASEMLRQLLMLQSHESLLATPAVIKLVKHVIILETKSFFCSHRQLPVDTLDDTERDVISFILDAKSLILGRQSLVCRHQVHFGQRVSLTVS
jgi:hypothetical protein